MTKAKIHISLKPGVLDPQGKAIKNALESIGFEGIENVRQGKFIELEIKQPNNSKTKEYIEDMCEKLLANTVVETYKIDTSD